MKERYIIGTRGSQLALWQAHEAQRLIHEATHKPVEIRVISTRGDERLDIALHSNTLSKGLFTQELEEALYRHEIDFAVHSLKDLPVEMDSHLCLAAVLERADVRDVVLANRPITSVFDLKGLHIGTSSPRRVAQLMQALGGGHGMTFSPIRGNVETRIAKLRRGEYEAIIMAAAGLHRLGLQQEIAYYLPSNIVTPAPGQAAVAIQCAVDNTDACQVAALVDHQLTHQVTHVERQILSLLGGGCAIPFGCYVHKGEQGLVGTAFFASEELTNACRNIFTCTDEPSFDELQAIASRLKIG